MRTLLAGIGALIIVAVTGGGCSDSGGPGGDTVLTTVEVTPSAMIRFTIAPGNTAGLAVVGKDQRGRTVAGSPTFSSDNDAIVSVSGNGAITALSAGIAKITASLTAGDVTKTGISTVTVLA